MSLSGKVAIVTGAGQGIGRAVALRLAKDGAAVAIADINEALAERVVDEVRTAGGRAAACVVDLTRLAQVEAMVARVLAEFGRIDILVNNAGWTPNQPFTEDTSEQWDRIIDINYKAQIYTTRSVLQAMTQQGGGSIINVASDAGRVGAPRQSVYAGSKAGVIGFSKALVTEVSKFGIRINVVSPSTTDTPLLREALSADQIQRREKAIPLGRIGQPDDLASAIAFFASDDSAYITGQVLSVNGGSSRLG